MFFLLGRRYPWISLVGGAIFLVIGIVAGSMFSVFIGCLGLVLGGYRMLASWRRGTGLLGSGRGGANGMLR
jgi:membrane protein implicated in regulation of membrane protease activity